MLCASPSSFCFGPVCWLSAAKSSHNQNCSNNSMDGKSKRRKHRYHLNTLWSIWYGLLFTYLQGYLILNGTYRFLGKRKIVRNADERKLFSGRGFFRKGLPQKGVEPSCSLRVDGGVWENTPSVEYSVYCLLFIVDNVAELHINPWLLWSSKRL